MTDITELAQSLKAAAEKATPGPWYVHDKPCEDGNYGIDTSDKEFLAEAVVWWGFARQSIWREEDAKYIALANPANILALVEALEKAQQRIDELENDEVRQRLANAEHQLYLAELAKHNLKASRKAQFRKRRAAEKRIAELESRTVTVKLASRRLPSDYVDGEFGNDDLAAIHNACRLECKVSVEKYLSAHGIVVKWEAE
ncbi:TPA: ead/Ea22-like family protein [Klebsiella quasipneumoniae subsp. similipneumoniae]|nr:ead/Ea22-like family protein [Klebsiella quasipneumoniae subsp. similipneumoniae]